MGKTFGATAATEGVGAGASVAAAGRDSIVAGVRWGALEHAARTPRMAAGRDCLVHRRAYRNMWLILLEALLALVVLLLIIWWTMFAGRRKGERK